VARLEGVWRIEREAGALPPFGLSKRIFGPSGWTLVGGLPAQQQPHEQQHGQHDPEQCRQATRPKRFRSGTNRPVMNLRIIARNVQIAQIRPHGQHLPAVLKRPYPIIWERLKIRPFHRILKIGQQKGDAAPVQLPFVAGQAHVMALDVVVGEP
jgi:hypothetical protein